MELSDRTVPLFSVVIPLYNKEDTIIRTLTSVNDQTLHDYEVIVVDDGSLDNGAKLVESFSQDKTIRLIRQKNAGVSAARNRGVREARGRFIAFLDADDEWKSGFLEECSKIIKCYPDAKVLGTSYEYVTSGKNMKGVESSRIDCIDFYNEWPYRSPLNSSSMVVEQDAFWDVGGYSRGIGFYEDAELLFKLAMSHRFYVSRMALARYNSDAIERATSKPVPYSKYPHWQWAAEMVKKGCATKSLQKCLETEWLRTLSNNARHFRFDINAALFDAYPILGKSVLKCSSRWVWTSWVGVMLGWLFWACYKIQSKRYCQTIASRT